LWRHVCFKIVEAVAITWFFFAIWYLLRQDRKHGKKYCHALYCNGCQRFVFVAINICCNKSSLNATKRTTKTNRCNRVFSLSPPVSLSSSSSTLENYSIHNLYIKQ
jgi:hypothetical protein